MLYLSKSKYCAFWQCPKLAWLTKYMPEKLKTDDSLAERMERGHIVGEMAKGLFGDFVDVSEQKNGSPDIGKMIQNTKEAIKNGAKIICEASFIYRGLFCAVDILKKEDFGWSIYEVKSSTHGNKDVYVTDVAYQKYVLENCGIDIVGAFTICLNSDYIFDGVLDLERLFKINDVLAAADAETTNIIKNLSLAEKLLSSKNEPKTEISEKCKKPYICGFWEYCSRHLPEKSVFDLYGMDFSKKLNFYRRNIISFEDLFKSNEIKDKKQKRQLEHELFERPTYIDKSGISKFLKTLSFPLYFLDFETEQPVIPKYVGTKPYEQIPFQYSLHYIENENGELKHREFLGVSGEDPRRAIAEQLCRDIPKNVCVVAYNKGFESSQLKKLAEEFPDLSNHLISISENLRDLIIPFRSGFYYNRAMNASFSIKSVLPAMFPNDPSLDYHNLETVHNGGEAMNLFPKIRFLPPDEQEKARKSLLEYCRLDTYAMVKIWEELSRIANEG